MSPSLYTWLADAVLALHATIVLFVLLAVPWVACGYHRRWPLADRLGFRLLHLAAIGLVIAESWLGIRCPLTELEAWLRRRAGETFEAESFVGYWLQQLLYWNLPSWVFTLAYSLFGLLVLLLWWRLPPRRPSPRRPA